MAYPTLTKSGVPSVLFSRGPSYPSSRVITPRQLVTPSEAGLVRVATLGVPDETFPVTFERLPQGDIDAALVFVQHANVNWAANPVTYTDVESTAWTVRILQFTFTLVALQLYNAQFLLRKELV